MMVVDGCCICIPKDEVQVFISEFVHCHPLVYAIFLSALNNKCQLMVISYC